MAPVTTTGGATASSGSNTTGGGTTTGGTTTSGGTNSSSGAGGSTTGGTSGGSTTGGTTANNQNNTGPTSPRYEQNGFVATDENAITLTNVIEMDANGVAKNFRYGGSTDFDLRFDPVNGRIQIFSEGRALDGTIDAESRTFTGSGPTFGTASPNFVRVTIGDWFYAVDGAIDQNDGRFRHDIAVVGGRQFQPPTSGAGVYDGFSQGVVELIRNNQSNSVPYYAPGSLTVRFDTKAVFGGYQFDSGRSNGMSGSFAISNAIANGPTGLNSSGGFTQAINALVTLNGFQLYSEGQITGFVAGPNGEEAAAVIGMSHDGGSYVSAITGTISGRDDSR